MPVLSSGICRSAVPGRRRSPRGRRRGCAPRARSRPSCCAATAATSRSCTRHSIRTFPSSPTPIACAVRRRRRRAGADCAILDDGFQHRRLARTVDWVLVAAEQLARSARLLPAGPLARAAARARARDSSRSSRGRARRLEVAATSLHGVTAGYGDATARSCIWRRTTCVDARDRTRASVSSVCAACACSTVAAIGASDAFVAQLREQGVGRLRPHRVPRIITRSRAADVARIVRAIERRPTWCCARSKTP